MSGSTSTLVDTGTYLSSTGNSMLESLPFQAGATHIAGTYRFTDQNYLIEGARTVYGLGSRAIFIYMDARKYASQYPQNNGTPWPAAPVASLVDLAKSEPYKAVFSMPFNTIVMSTFSNSVNDQVETGPFSTDPATYAPQEQREFYDLTKYLLTAYRGSGKIFILKNWEGDWFSMKSYNTGVIASSAGMQLMNQWWSARQDGVNKARAELGPVPGVAVYHAAEVNLVVGAISGTSRLINSLVPYISTPPDMVSYSSYDSIDVGSSASGMKLGSALNFIDAHAPDPLGLGRKRIFVSEFAFQDSAFKPSDAQSRTQAVLQTAAQFGAGYVFYWEVFDNECANGGVTFPTASFGAAAPAPSQCPGFWLVRPDGQYGPVTGTLQSHWNSIASQLPQLPQSFDPINPDPPVINPYGVVDDGVSGTQVYLSVYGKGFGTDSTQVSAGVDCDGGISYPNLSPVPGSLSDGQVNLAIPISAASRSCTVTVTVSGTSSAPSTPAVNIAGYTLPDDQLPNPAISNAGYRGPQGRSPCEWVWVAGTNFPSIANTQIAVRDADWNIVGNVPAAWVTPTEFAFYTGQIQPTVRYTSDDIQSDMAGPGLRFTVVNAALPSSQGPWSTSDLISCSP